ncbi:hypothetical protein [Nocardia sp. NBC_00403]|uniref:hypothetical protein n=1 Tax=Nocardia sp. NBC_00403 TaxID=2975990 RepID=UPI002E1C7AA2
MIGEGGILIGFIVVIGLPLAVLVAVILWPERIPKERTVEAIRQRVEDERGRPESGSDRR